MSYNPNKFTVTKLNDGRFNYLQINYEADYDYDEKSQRYPSFYFSPDTKEHNHYHIKLTRDKAVILKRWLEDYLIDCPPGINNNKD